MSAAAFHPDGAPPAKSKLHYCASTRTETHVDESKEASLPELLTSTEAARALSVSHRTVFNLISSGALPAVKVGRCTRFRRSDLESYIASLRPLAGKAA